MGFKIRVFIFISLFLCSTSTFASKSRNLKNQINQHERTILKIKKKIEEMEKNLVSSNSHYLKMEKEKTRLEGKLFQANLKIKKVKENVEAELVNSQKILNALVINQLSENKTSKEILREKLLQFISYLQLPAILFHLSKFLFLLSWMDPFLVSKPV